MPREASMERVGPDRERENAVPGSAPRLNLNVNGKVQHVCSINTISGI